MKIKENESLAEFYIRFADQENEELTINDYFEAAGIEENYRNDFILAAILKGVEYILDKSDI